MSKTLRGQYIHGMTPLEIRGSWRILKWYIFRGLNFLEILGGSIL